MKTENFQFISSTCAWEQNKEIDESQMSLLFGKKRRKLNFRVGGIAANDYIDNDKSIYIPGASQNLAIALNTKMNLTRLQILCNPFWLISRILVVSLFNTRAQKSLNEFKCQLLKQSLTSVTLLKKTKN